MSLSVGDIATVSCCRVWCVVVNGRQGGIMKICSVLIVSVLLLVSCKTSQPITNEQVTKVIDTVSVYMRDSIINNYQTIIKTINDTVYVYQTTYKERISTKDKAKSHRDTVVSQQIIKEQKGQSKTYSKWIVVALVVIVGWILYAKTFVRGN